MNKKSFDNLPVYNVFDDEWEDTMGSEQLRDFALMQTGEFINCNNNKEIENEINFYVQDNLKKRIKKLVNAVNKNTININDITDNEAIELLKLRSFEVEKLNIH